MGKDKIAFVVVRYGADINGVEQNIIVVCWQKDW